MTLPCVFDDPIDCEWFGANFREQMVPILKPGDVLILDTLGFHKVKAWNSLQSIAT
ncbi:hypothetical protein [Rhizobium sp. BK068]|uniref:hypothetical protein n=1 Tax=Rhizobium sp. BK068 TaxID=2512130 RepID=UPI0010F1825F|nr:hypothetical protein [Rhizobium sp. BK068]TCM76682.1 hypothetical protein EV291_109101 [Rhizobium sp. BK068]